MSRRLSVLLALIALATVVAPARARAQASCDTATATPFVQVPGTNPRVVERVFCGSLLGPGSQTMLAQIAVQGGCPGNSGWQVFALAGGAWTPDGDGVHAGSDTLASDGSTVTETRSIHRRSDWTACLATGGVQTRTWTWNGANGLTAGAWQQTTPPLPDGLVLPPIARAKHGQASVSFWASGHRFQCDILDDRTALAGCAHRVDRYSTASITASGRLKSCIAPPHEYGCDIGDPGEGDVTKTLTAGHSVIVGRFQCFARKDAVKCVVIRTGRGFLIDRRGVHRLRGSIR